MIDESNPAGRLHKILTHAKKCRDHDKVREVWSKVLGVEDNDVTVTKAVIDLYSLSNEIQSLIKMNEGLNHELYLKSFNSIDSVFFPLNLGSNWNSAKSHLSDEALTRLQFCAEQLSQFYCEETLPVEELEQIIEKIELLFDAVYSSNLPDTLRLSLLEEVEKLRRAIAMYKIKGAKGLKEALQGAIGSVIVNQEELVKSSTTEPDVIERLGELIDKLDSFTARALKLKKVLTKPIQFLLEKATAPTASQEETNADA